MLVTDALVEKLAHLARLEFDEKEKEGIKKDLQQMISFVEKLNELDTSGVEPLLHMSEVSQVLREDDVFHPLSREEALANAPAQDGQYFLVPKVIDKGAIEE